MRFDIRRPLCVNRIEMERTKIQSREKNLGVFEKIPAEKRKAIRLALIQWFQKTGRDLPWRTDRSAYRVWISEIMAQQTRIDTVVPYFLRFIERFPNVTALAAAPLDDVLALWSGLGYYRRAIHLHQAAWRIVEQLGGRIPDRVDELLQLPGIGRYTAGAIASIAFDRPAPILDGNVIRVLTRLFDLGADPKNITIAKQLWALSESLVPKTRPGVFNEGLMELGALVCTPKNPDCAPCPLRRHCLAQANETVAQRPGQSAKTTPKKINLYGALIKKPDGDFLLVKHPLKGTFSGLWMVPYFPTDLSCTVRAGKARIEKTLSEQLGRNIVLGQKLGTLTHILSHRELTLHLYQATIETGRIRTTDFVDHLWIRDEGRLKKLGLATLTRKTLTLGKIRL